MAGFVAVVELCRASSEFVVVSEGDDETATRALELDRTRRGAQAQSGAPSRCA